MATKQNCWEMKNCGRGPGGSKVAELGVCPAASAVEYNKINDGTNGGRFCWIIAGTLCGGKVQGSFASKMLTCLACEVFEKIKDEEKGNFITTLKSSKSNS